MLHRIGRQSLEVVRHYPAQLCETTGTENEIGTLSCATVNYDSKDGRGVTIRNRDTMQQSA